MCRYFFFVRVLTVLFTSLSIFCSTSPPSPHSQPFLLLLSFPCTALHSTLPLNLPSTFEFFTLPFHISHKLSTSHSTSRPLCLLTSCPPFGCLDACIYSVLRRGAPSPPLPVLHRLVRRGGRRMCSIFSPPKP